MRVTPFLLHQCNVECVESGLDGIAPPDRDIPVQNLLEHLGVRHQRDALADAAL